MSEEETIKLLAELVAQHSVTPDDKDCQKIIRHRLKKLGFKITSITSGKVSNMWATYGTEEPVIAFVGHTDVVPPGNLELWNSDPFTLTERDGILYGRGVADMKGGVAAMITAVERFIKKNPNPKFTIGFIITSDEEGEAVDGTIKIVEFLEKKNQPIHACIVGEPSSHSIVGDTIKHGRRGSISGRLIIKGRQGHVAYPEQAENPIHRSGPIITDLSNTIWDEGNADFPPTTFQISNVSGGTGVENVIPGSVEFYFNFRFSTELNVDKIQNKMISILNKHNACYELSWEHPAYPFLTHVGLLLNTARQAVKEIVGIEPKLSTSGGTSDGRFVATMGAHVIELGLPNATIHAIDEHVSRDDIHHLSLIYEKILQITEEHAEDPNFSKKLLV